MKTMSNGFTFWQRTDRVALAAALAVIFLAGVESPDTCQTVT